MKVTPEDVIQQGEQDLIDGITADLDWDAVETLFKEKHHLPLGEDVVYKKGDLVVHEDRIAYLLEFEVKVPLTMLLDRRGNCITLQTDPCSSPADGSTSSDHIDEADSTEHGTPAASGSSPETGDDAPAGEGSETPDSSEGLPPCDTEEGPEARIARMASDAQKAISGL